MLSWHNRRSRGAELALLTCSAASPFHSHIAQWIIGQRGCTHARGAARVAVALAVAAPASPSLSELAPAAQSAEVVAWPSARTPLHILCPLCIPFAILHTEHTGGIGLRMTWPPTPTACLGREGTEHAELRRDEVRVDPVRELHPVRLRARRHLGAGVRFILNAALCICEENR